MFSLLEKNNFPQEKQFNKIAVLFCYKKYKCKIENTVIT